MVYNNGKPYSNGWFGGTTIFGNTHIDFRFVLWCLPDIFVRVAKSSLHWVSLISFRFHVLWVVSPVEAIGCSIQTSISLQGNPKQNLHIASGPLFSTFQKKGATNPNPLGPTMLQFWCWLPPGTPNNHFLMDVWWNNHFLHKGLESSNWNNHL